MPNKLTHEKFCEKLYTIYKDNYIPCEHYINSLTKIKFYCTICHNYFYNTPFALLHGTRCKRCISNNRRKEQEQRIIKQIQKLHGDKYTLLEPYVSIYTKIKIHCNACNEDRYMQIRPLLYGSQMYCCYLKQCRLNKPAKTHEQFLQDLNKIYNSNIIPVEKYINARTKINFKCNICNYKMEKHSA